MTDRPELSAKSDSARVLAELAAQSSVPREKPVRLRDEPAFVLTSWPWKESSLIADILTRSHGRMAVVVRGAKRPGSVFRGLIDPFNPLLVNVTGAGEVKKLMSARWMGGIAPLSGEGLVCGFYLNELVLRMTVREDPAPRVFDAYTEALSAVSAASSNENRTRALRCFEVDLLRALGWGQTLAGEVEGLWSVRDGEFVPARADDVQRFSPQVVQAVLARDFSADQLLLACRDALRLVIGHYVGEGEIQTRRSVRSWHFMGAGRP
ncbi:MAG TPA: DNA repair protein RecO [Sutterella sp.]|nr:DNA repair protein RecO [Sutterella sp.]